MIEQAFLRISSLVFSAAILLAVGCKDTQSAGSGPTVTQEPGGSAAVSGPPAGDAPGQTAVDPTPAATATAGDTKPPDESTDVFVECTTRSKMCTREYRPVCGKSIDGTRRTYGNKCVACSDEQVLGYTAGACESDEPKPPV